MNEVRKLNELGKVKKPNDTKMVTMPLKEFQEEIEYNKVISANEKDSELREKIIIPMLQENSNVINRNLELLNEIDNLITILLPNELKIHEFKNRVISENIFSFPTTMRILNEKESKRT